MNRTRSSVAFTGQFREVKRASIFNLIPTESDSSKGLRWQVYALRFKEHFKLSETQLDEILPRTRELWTYGTPGDQKTYREKDILEQWSGYTGFMTLNEAEQFVEKIKQMK